ncbi:MAG: hypothetical protein ACREJC_02060 [Tepidisphaeraceae bacterium]
MLFGGILLASILTPALSPGSASLLPKLLTAGVVVDGIGIVWLIVAFCTQITLLQWLLCYLVLVAYSLALLGVTCALSRLGATIASAITTLIALAWLTWPIWLASHLGGAAINALVKLSPLLAINGVVREFGIWTQHRIVYRYTSLGQDVAYELPGVWTCIAGHALIGAVLLLPVILRVRSLGGAGLSDR